MINNWLHTLFGCWPFWFHWYLYAGRYKHRRCTHCGREQFNWTAIGWNDRLPTWYEHERDAGNGYRLPYDEAE